MNDNVATYKSHQNDLKKWFAMPLGKRLTAVEEIGLNKILNEINGEDLLFLGHPLQVDLIDEHNISQRVIFHLIEDKINSIQLVSGNHKKLPVLNEGVDVVVLAHILEFAENPYQVLREIAYMLRPNGYLVLLGFNPYSLFGIRRIFSSKKYAPWSGCFHSVFCIKRWLHILNFNVTKHKRAFYDLPTVKQNIIFRLGFLELLGKLKIPLLSGVYFIVAQKSVKGLTLLRPHWKDLANVAPSEVINSATRSIDYD